MIGRHVILKTLVLATLVTAPASGQYFSQPPRQQGMPSGVSAASYAAGAWDEPESSGPVIHERMLSRDRGWGYQDTNLDRLLRVLVRNTWIRLDYMNFESKRPGDHLLGADNPMVNDERLPFAVSSG